MHLLETQILAPAKVNLFLRVLGRRADGYHFLDSLIAPISLYDEISIRLAPPAQPSMTQSEIAVTSDSAAAPGGDANLAYRAAALLLERADYRTAVDIHIRKRIPVGSGLGGGSSDAAAVLLVLNRLLGSPLPIQELAAVGTQIGADVAFFLCGGPARIGGIGERVTRLTFGTSLSLVIGWDRCNLSTKQVYARAARSLTSPLLPSNIASFVSGRAPISEILVNDLEAAAAQLHPEVMSLKAKLVEQGALGALMTGSGAAVFGVWPDLPAARRAAERLRAQGLWAEAVHTLDASPAAAN